MAEPDATDAAGPSQGGRFIAFLCGPVGYICFIWGFGSIAYATTSNLWDFCAGESTPFPLPQLIKQYIASAQPLLDVHVGLIAALTGVGSLLYRTMYRAGNLPRMAEKVEQGAIRIEKSAGEVVHYARDNAGRALDMVRSIIDLRFSTARKDPRHITSASNAMSAIACNLRNWESHVSDQYETGCHFLTEVWIRAQDAYFLEEGYDIGKGEFATNGRNFCFLLLATLDALIAERAGKKVLYSAVTPVNPKDWYNWPHGHAAPKIYHEDPFIGDYQRLLRETVAANTGEVLCHRRYVLCHESKLPRDEQPFGWVLDSAKEMRQHLNGWIIPVSIPLECAKKRKNAPGLTGDIVRHIGALHEYFERVMKAPADSSFVPLFSTKWAKAPDTIEALLSQAPDSAIVRELKDMAFNWHEAQVSQLCGREPAADLDAELRELLKGLLSSGPACLSAPQGSESVLHWMRLSHSLEAQLAGSAQGREEADLIQQLRQCVLRCRDNVHWKSNAPTTVGEAFSRQLQTTSSDSHVRTLTPDDLKTLRKRNIEPEFHLFGYELADGTAEWKLAITTSLDYPFDVTRISFRDRPEDVLAYTEALATISAAARPMTDFMKDP